MKPLATMAAAFCAVLLLSSSVCIKEDTGSASLNGKTFLVCANSMVYFGGFVQKGDQRQPDDGMFHRLMKAHGIDVNVMDCTYGGHHLYDYTSSDGCHTTGGGCPGEGKDLLEGVDLSKVDYVIISESGNNNDHFYSDAAALFGRVTEKNPYARKLYVNHIYCVFKHHNNILDKLSVLHDSLGVTIINCGQLAYDIYSGNVKVPGGTISYSDKYTFVNHAPSDSHHPNPLMGWIMTEMVYCALTGDYAWYPDYLSLVQSCMFATGSVSYTDYYNTYYTTAAALPFTNVLENVAEMKGIQQLIPEYINKY